MDWDFIGPAADVARYSAGSGPLCALPYVGNAELFTYRPDYTEAAVRLTSDGVGVLCRDPVFPPGAGSLPIAATTFDRLRRSAAENVTLGDALDFSRQSGPALDIDLKSPKAGLAVVREKNRLRSTVSFVSGCRLEGVGRLKADIPNLLVLPNVDEEDCLPGEIDAAFTRIAE